MNLEVFDTRNDIMEWKCWFVLDIYCYSFIACVKNETNNKTLGLEPLKKYLWTSLEFRIPVNANSVWLLPRHLAPTDFQADKML